MTPIKHRDAISNTHSMIALASRPQPAFASSHTMMNQSTNLARRLRRLAFIFHPSSFILLISLSTAQAQPPEAPLTETAVIEKVTGSVDRAVRYLADKQRPDGGWHD